VTGRGNFKHLSTRLLIVPPTSIMSPLRFYTSIHCNSSFISLGRHVYTSDLSRNYLVKWYYNFSSNYRDSKLRLNNINRVSAVLTCNTLLRLSCIDGNYEEGMLSCCILITTISM
jgi:hypothetical protein